MSVSSVRKAINITVLARISDYLARHPRFIDAADVREMTALGVSEEQAVYLLACAAMGLGFGYSAFMAGESRRFRI